MKFNMLCSIKDNFVDIFFRVVLAHRSLKKTFHQNNIHHYCNWSSFKCIC